MKTALMSLVVLASFNAFAATTLEYKISAPAVVPSQYGVNPADVQFCPTPLSLTVQQDADLKGLSLVFSTADDIIGTSPSGSSRTCMSDIVCPTDDNFNLANGNGYASLTRNNDSDYPTTDLPGYSSLSIHLNSAPSKKGSVDCYYSISK